MAFTLHMTSFLLGCEFWGKGVVGCWKGAGHGLTNPFLSQGDGCLAGLLEQKEADSVVAKGMLLSGKGDQADWGAAFKVPCTPFPSEMYCFYPNTDSVSFSRLAPVPQFSLP
jgi:hypothetical protein